MSQRQQSPDCFYLFTPSCPELKNPSMKKYDRAQDPRITAELTSRDYEEIIHLCEKCLKYKVFH